MPEQIIEHRYTTHWNDNVWETIVGVSVTLTITLVILGITAAIWNYNCMPRQNVSCPKCHTEFMVVR